MPHTVRDCRYGDAFGYGLTKRGGGKKEKRKRKGGEIRKGKEEIFLFPRVFTTLKEEKKKKGSRGEGYKKIKKGWPVNDKPLKAVPRKKGRKEGKKNVRERATAPV